MLNKTGIIDLNRLPLNAQSISNIKSIKEINNWFNNCVTNTKYNHIENILPFEVG